MTPLIDTENHFAVSSRGFDPKVIHVLCPPLGPILAEDALVFAAWIVVLAERRDGEFARVLTAVRDSRLPRVSSASPPSTGPAPAVGA